LTELKKLGAEESLEGFVVGLPVHMDGSESRASKACREFGAMLAAHTGLPVEYGDERLSSWEAEGMLIEGGMKPSERKQRVHAVAAKLILEAFFTARKARHEAGSGPSGEQSDE
jgi:putative Holliday junction resolvase